MNPTDYIQSIRLNYQQSFLSLSVRLLERCGLFFMVYELLALTIRWFRQLSFPQNLGTFEFMAGRHMVIKLGAFILVTLCVARFTQNYNAIRLLKLDSMNADAFIQHARHAYQPPYLAILILQLVMSGLFVGSIEFIAYVIKLGIPKKVGA